MIRRTLETKRMAAPRAKKKILIVEDDPAFREIISILLQDAGYEVHEAEHAFGAICAMVRAGADLVLADIRMPIVDGFSMIRELRSHEDTRHVPVVVVTGFDTPESRTEAQKTGCIGYLTKPIDPRKFPGQIAEFLRQAKPQQTGATSPQKQQRPVAN